MREVRQGDRAAEQRSRCSFVNLLTSSKAFEWRLFARGKSLRQGGRRCPADPPAGGRQRFEIACRRASRLTRSYEIDELSAPVDKAEQLRALLRAIDADERDEAILKRMP